MTQTVNYRQMGTADRSQAHALFAQTMGYVAMTAGLFALGSARPATPPAGTWRHWPGSASGPGRGSPAGRVGLPGRAMSFLVFLEIFSGSAR
jgi:hypothetical protein